MTGARALRDAIRRGETSAEAACAAALERIDALDDTLHAFQHVAREAALERARALDRQGAPGGPLHGVPIALKDNIVTRGQPSTAGSRLLEGYVSPFDATVVERLERAGAVVVGKTVCDEFAMGSSTEHCAYGPARNPWNPGRIPGGSSGGSAVAVAAGLTPVALGSDTGGSVRQPAALCGVVGVKPTYGRVSRYGLIAFASSLDQIGPLARTVRDAALVLEAIAGGDPRDATAADRPFEPRWDEGVPRAVRVGVPRDLLQGGVDDDVMAAFEAAIATLRDRGASIVDVALPHSRCAIPVYYLIATAEASSNLARYDGVRYGRRAPDARLLSDMYGRTRRLGFGAEVTRRIMLGTFVLSEGYSEAYYLKAQQVRTLIRRDFETAFSGVDVIALPTSPTTAFPFGARLDDPLQMYLADVFTVGASLAGLPAISVPCGLSPARLPIGLQLIGRAWDEATLLAVGDAYERATAWAREAPDLTTPRRPRV
jgi:aspartyl-tRNA(Asn)/glutamyl-tRNA(Gln) amidotransferase subunit A